MADPTVHIITTQLAEGRDPGTWERRVVEKPLPVSQVAAGLKAFLTDVVAALDVSSALHGEFQLEELAFAAEVSPDGEFRLLGTAAGPVAGGFRFTLKRKHTVETADLTRLLVGTEPEDDPKLNLFRASLFTRTEDVGLPVQAHAALYTAADDQGKPVEIHVKDQVSVDINPKPLGVAIV